MTTDLRSLEPFGNPPHDFICDQMAAFLARASVGLEVP